MKLNKWTLLQTILTLAILLNSIGFVVFHMITGNVFNEVRVINITLLAVQFATLILEFSEYKELEKQQKKRIDEISKQIDKHIPRID